ncbi:MAG: TIGR01777 family protein [Candidatus Omnitrophica bacterium]|nr:TIGR01777 family protein [Candidatus Omnitrophota bacterium]
MKILLTGSSGFVGKPLYSRLRSRGERILRLVRRPPGLNQDQILWNPEGGKLDPAPLQGVNAAIHLAGDPIAHGRWTPAKKREIRDSRVLGTQLLAGTLARLTPPPQVLICASAVGYYGDRGDEPLTEESGRGGGFLAETGEEWEAACKPAAAAGIRVVNLRFGIILDPAGGALKMMLPPFRAGIGGPLGSGRQWMSWITREDAIGVVLYALSTTSLKGPVNAVSPSPVTNTEFSRALGKALRRPAFLPVPAFAVRLLFGEMADEALLASTRVLPKKLRESGFAFRHPELQPALEQMLRQPRPS